MWMHIVAWCLFLCILMCAVFVVCISMCCVYVDAYMHLDNMMYICVHIDVWFICLCISMCGVYLIASRNTH